MLDFIFYASIEKHKCYNFLHRLQKWNEWLQIYKIIYEKIQNIIVLLIKSIYRNIVTNYQQGIDNKYVINKLCRN